MQIQKTCYAPSFNAKFINNEAFRDVVMYAQKNKCMRTLDCALNTIKKANPAEIRCQHGITEDGKIYSNFTVGRSAISNPAAEASCPAEATYNGILNLSMLTREFKSLVGIPKRVQVEERISPNTLLKEYTV